MIQPQKIREFCNDIIALASGDFSQDFVNDLKLFPFSQECFENWHCCLKEKESDLETKDDFCNKVKDNVESSYGRQLPGFLHYGAFESSAKYLIRKLEEPALEMQKEISDKVKSVLTKLAYKHFAGLPNLLKETKVIIDKIRQMQEHEANQMIKTLFRMESMIYTQDATYSYRLELMEDTEEGSMHINNKGLMSTESVVSLLTTHLKIYYKIASDRLVDLVPMAIKYYQMQESITKLQGEMFSILQKRDLVDELVEEEGTAAEKRRNLIERRERLNKARLALIKF
ncbi:interferon-induced GTP-binding protein Mx-like [Acipenser oxyrinchus oxyrinchus]|uniref:Interferon-induced GTP-binding protein Mx-like n=1 Tax=Acipenser oxyrinchus oxyrinchus TaxID=40147 RepID=A0AAD8FPF7_ACIOX|nr:interferon-induced GTP-binding protein Mx-like [Acipenser oxyrinchus oxyrinchus]